MVNYLLTTKIRTNKFIHSKFVAVSVSIYIIYIEFLYVDDNETEKKKLQNLSLQICSSIN